MNERKGFTLIELLVVIGIIVLLATIILVALSKSRTYTVDSKIKSDVKDLSAQLNLIYVDNAGYGQTYSSAPCQMTSNSPSPDSIFYADTEIRARIARIQATTGGKTTYCASGGINAPAAQTWAIATPLSSGDSITGPFWCVDSAGQAKLVLSPQIENPYSRLVRGLFLIPIAYASVGPPPGPNLGGGSNPAVCP